ncbi:MAG: flagellar biosynthetic protein FliR [Thermoleophilia bacterium]|nr:flagellar biosynthetic protein FliR [Thermoleophilia bacterium]MCZ4495748.1 flagellar biosynthetic protein FliR [Thermoleophilia bacterium]
MEIPVDWAIPQIITFFLVVARLSGMFLIAPVFSSGMIPGRFKVMIMLVLAAMLTPIVAPKNAEEVPTELLDLVIAMGMESLIGFSMGFAVAIVFSAVQVGASLIDTSMGLSMASIVDPLNNAQSAVMGSFYSMVATLVFLAVNGHHWMLAGFVRSFDMVGAGQMPDVEKLMANVFASFTGLFTIAFQVAAPILVTLLLVDIVLGIVSRVVPQMNVFFVGAPLKIGVGLLAVIIALPSFAGFLENRVSDIMTGASVLAGQDDPRTAGEVNAADGS